MRISIILLGLILVLGQAGQAIAEEAATKPEIALPQGTLTAREVFALFNNKTVYSLTAVQKRESISFYAPSGEIRQQRNGIERIGRWWVAESGRICLQMEDLPEKCRIIVREKGTYNKYIVRKNGEHQLSVSYPAFRDGNPLGL
jgi:hypothetical protein